MVIGVYPGQYPGFFVIFQGMKKVELVTTIICDVCHNTVSDYQLAKLNRAGYANAGENGVNYGMTMVLTNGGCPVEQVCKDCMRKILNSIANDIGEN